jgi:hypothetical protein
MSSSGRKVFIGQSEPEDVVITSGPGVPKIKFMIYIPLMK